MSENFPVASVLIAPRLRAPILSFYRFARAADDIADHPTLSESEKFARLDALEDTLLGKCRYGQGSAAAAARARGAVTCRPHIRSICSTAFRADVTKRRYADWAELMQYCRYSAMPVGRFVLDLHGEERSTWAYSDPLCAALQVINHLQDCAKDYRALDRVYLPLDSLTAHGIGVEALAAPRPRPALRAALSIHCRARPVSSCPKPRSCRLRSRTRGSVLRPGAIVRLAQRLIALLMTRDPLSERVHLTKAGAVLHGGARRGGHACGEARSVPRASSRAGTSAMSATERQSEAPEAPATSVARSSFYLAMRILAPEQRQAMYEVYAFCRAVDDIADDGGPRSERIAKLESLAGGHRAALCRRRADRADARACRARADLRSAAGGFPRHHRWHGDGRAARYPGARIGRRSIFIATAWPRRSGGFRSGFSASRTRRGGSCRITSAAPCR